MCNDSPEIYEHPLSGTYTGKKPYFVCQSRYRAVQVPVWSGIQISATFEDSKTMALKAVQKEAHPKTTQPAESGLSSLLSESKEVTDDETNENKPGRQLLAGVGFWRRRRRRRRYIIRYDTRYQHYCHNVQKERIHTYRFTERYTFKRKHGTCTQYRSYTKTDEANTLRSFFGHPKMRERSLETTNIKICKSQSCQKSFINCYAPPLDPSKSVLETTPIVTQEEMPATIGMTEVNQQPTELVHSNTLKHEVVKNVKAVASAPSSEKQTVASAPSSETTAVARKKESLKEEALEDEVEKLKKKLAAANAENKNLQEKVTQTKQSTVQHFRTASTGLLQESAVGDRFMQQDKIIPESVVDGKELGEEQFVSSPDASAIVQENP
jgi:hypothetical protein